MNLLVARAIRITTIAFVAIAVRDARAQAPKSISITLMVPVEVKNLDPRVAVVRVHCTAQPVGVTGAVTFNGNDFADAGPVVDGAFDGLTQVVLSGTLTKALAPGQQWSYQCHSDFLTSAAGSRGEHATLTPGGAGATLAAASGPNLVKGTFTSQ